MKAKPTILFGCILLLALALVSITFFAMSSTEEEERKRRSANERLPSTDVGLRVVLDVIPANARQVSLDGDVYWIGAMKPRLLRVNTVSIMVASARSEQLAHISKMEFSSNSLLQNQLRKTASHTEIQSSLQTSSNGDFVYAIVKDIFGPDDYHHAVPQLGFHDLAVTISHTSGAIRNYQLEPIEYVNNRR